MPLLQHRISAPPTSLLPQPHQETPHPPTSFSLVPGPVAFEPLQPGCLVLQQVTHAWLWRLREERYPQGKEKKFGYCRGG